MINALHRLKTRRRLCIPCMLHAQARLILFDFLGGYCICMSTLVDTLVGYGVCFEDIFGFTKALFAFGC